MAQKAATLTYGCLSVTLKTTLNVDLSLDRFNTAKNKPTAPLRNLEST